MPPKPAKRSLPTGAKVSLRIGELAGNHHDSVDEILQELLGHERRGIELYQPRLIYKFQRPRTFTQDWLCGKRDGPVQFVRGDVFLDDDGAGLTARASAAAFTRTVITIPAGSQEHRADRNGLWDVPSKASLLFVKNHIDRIAVGSSLVFFGGDAHSFAMMANGYYRLKTGWPLTPYIGGGIGEVVIVLNNLRAPGIGTTFWRN
jgi:hypothetical protein